LPAQRQQQQSSQNLQSLRQPQRLLQHLRNAPPDVRTHRRLANSLSTAHRMFVAGHSLNLRLHMEMAAELDRSHRFN
jgi:hypothetical protein